MILYKNKEISQIFKGTKPISAIYLGAKLVWQAVRSCFGSGSWFNEKPWVNSEPWKN